MKIRTFTHAVLLATLTATSLPGSNALADEWTCGPIYDGPPGICPDCLWICAKIVGTDALYLAVQVDESQAATLCALEVVVKQGSTTIFQGPAPLDEPLKLDEGFYELDPESLDTSATNASLLVGGWGTFGESPMSCD